MQKRIFIIHGWGGMANEGWLSWLKEELEAAGYLVFALQMPNTNEPRIKTWVKSISDSVGLVDGNTFFIGHSIGCQAIARYLEGLQRGVMVGGAVFVAGFFKNLTNMGNDALSRDIIHEWLDTPIDLISINSHLLKSLAIFSDNDPYVSLDNIEDFKNNLNAEIIIEHEQGHYSGSSGLPKYPSILDNVKVFIGD
jgi:predicted alpha/beta hydrolase family esterase